MTRIVLDIDSDDDLFALKEAIAMALEQFGRVRVVSIHGGKQL